MLEVNFCNTQLLRAPKSTGHEFLWIQRQSSAKSSVPHSFQSCHGRHSGRNLLLVWGVYLATIMLFSGGPSTVGAQDALAQGRTLRSLATTWKARFSDWELNDDPCHGKWTGVVCDPENSKVLSLRLVSKSLNGSIPKEIGQLVFLEQLDLTNNTLEGAIPSEIGKLTRLQNLTLNGNNLKSPPPKALLSCNLTELSLNRNSMIGELPTWIGEIARLVKLDMQANNFWGGLPPEYGKLKNLRTLELWQNQLSGHIPDEWRGMTSIENFKLGHNSLTGTQPEWLFELSTLKIMDLPRNQFVGQFPNLTRLLLSGSRNVSRINLECNFFKGDYPQLYNNTFSPGLNTVIKYKGNCFDNETDTSPTINRNASATQDTPSFCGRPLDCKAFDDLVKANPGRCAPCPSEQHLIDEIKCICGREKRSKSTSLVGAVVGGVVGGVFAIIGALLLMLVCYKKSLGAKYPDFGRMHEGIDEPWNVPKELRRFRLHELEKATDNFDAKCFTGSGGFGKVYRGVLLDGTIVAIKCAALHSAQGQTEFRNELTLLSRLHHRNLVRLEGFCDDDGLQILVYEYMENGDLRDNIFGKGGKLPLNSLQRLEVVLGIARGLDYLHSFADPPVIHRDIKLSNVLLNQSMVAKLADFGVSRISAEIDTHVSTAPVGTRGYLDPDYFRTHQLTTASDVYAFGIVLLEIITGLPVIDFTRLDALSLDAWVEPRFSEGGVRAIIDRKLDIGYDEGLFTDMATLALRCSSHDRLLRPSMKDALSILEPYSRMLREAPSHQRIEWSTTYFRSSSLFEQESSSRCDSAASLDSISFHMGTIEGELLPLGLNSSNHFYGTHHSPGPSRSFTDPTPR